MILIGTDCPALIARRPARRRRRRSVPTSDAVDRPGRGRRLRADRHRPAAAGPVRTASPGARRRCWPEQRARLAAARPALGANCARCGTWTGRRTWQRLAEPGLVDRDGMSATPMRMPCSGSLSALLARLRRSRAWPPMRSTSAAFSTARPGPEAARRLAALHAGQAGAHHPSIPWSNWTASVVLKARGRRLGVGRDPPRCAPIRRKARGCRWTLAHGEHARQRRHPHQGRRRLCRAGLCALRLRRQQASLARTRQDRRRAPDLRRPDSDGGPVLRLGQPAGGGIHRLERLHPSPAHDRRAPTPPPEQAAG
ncbi:MAG: hypothetical protein MZW92_50220 [Comamonadaceae bacterium]|nr:hypothetical protein [Comamonadaceae bacterium]